MDELFTPVEASSVIQTIFEVDRATFVVADFFENKLRVFTRLDGSKEVSKPDVQSADGVKERSQEIVSLS